MKTKSKYIAGIILLILVFLFGWCSGPTVSKTESIDGLEKALQNKNDSLTKLTAAYEKRNASLEKFILQQNVKIKRIDSTRISQISKFRKLKYKEMPCDSALPAVILQTEKIIETDSTQIAMLQHKTDSMQVIHENDKQIHLFDLQKHENDSTLNAAVKSENVALKRSNRNLRGWNQFWKVIAGIATLANGVPR